MNIGERARAARSLTVTFIIAFTIIALGFLAIYSGYDAFGAPIWFVAALDTTFLVAVFVFFAARYRKMEAEASRIVNGKRPTRRKVKK